MENASFLLIPFIIIGFCIVFVGIWSFVCVLISLTGGWWRLAKYYRIDHEPVGKWRNGFFAMLGIASYRGTLNLKICAEGLYLKVNPLFKIAHPPLLIPWHDLRINSNGAMLTSVELGNPPICTLRTFISAQDLNPASID